jgi:GNAT acetyltransferase-like protein
MIQVEASPRMDGVEWERVVEACGGHPLHLPEVHEVEQAGSERMYLHFRNGTQTIACALAYRTASGRFRKRPRRFVLPASPAVRADADPSLRASIYEETIALARGQGCSEIIIQPHWGPHLEDVPLLAPHVSEIVIEFVLDLHRDPEAIEAGMHRVHRKNVRRAERDGVTVHSDATLDGLLTLRSMQQVSSERSAKKGGGFTVRDRSFFERLHQSVYATGRGELLLAFKDGKAVAGLAYLRGAGRAITVRSGSTPEGYELRAMYLLQSSVIERARERGALELNLGGVPLAAATLGHPQHGLYEFKRGWGGTEIRSSGIRMGIAA